MDNLEIDYKKAAFMYAASAADQCGSARYLVIVLYVGMFV